MRKAIVLFLFVTAVMQVTCFGQITRLDSLKHNINKAAAPQLKLQALLTFCDEWESMTPDTLHKYTQMAHKVAVGVQNKDALLQCDYYLAAYLFQNNKLDTALNTINDVIKQISKTTPYANRYSIYYGLRANILMRGLHFGEVLKQNFKLLPLAEKHNDTVSLIRFSTGIGNVYLRLKKLADALQWHYRALSLMRTDELKSKCSFVYINIAIVYYHIATLNDTRANEDSIEMYQQKAIRYARKGYDLTNLANGLVMYGSTLAEYGKLKPAKIALNEAIEVRKKIGDIHSIIGDMTLLSTLYEKSNNNAKAIAINQQALLLANQNGGDILSKAAVYDVMAEIYSSAGNYKKLGEVQLEQLKLRDSIYKENTAEAIAEMQTKYETQKKENTIIKQKYDLDRKQYFIYGITGLLLLLSVLGLMILKYRKQKQKQKISEILTENERKMQKAIADAKDDERKRIIADLHDDVGGGLSTIRMVSDLIAEQKEQTEQLNQYALKISGITKEVTQRMNTIVWALNAENDTLQSLSEYIRLYGFAFFEDSLIEFKCNLPDVAANIQLSGLQRKNIFLCVKEALNNVFKHSGARNAWIDIGMSNNFLTLIVHDDGGGLSNENLFGNGLKNIKKRMKEINGDASFETSNGVHIHLQIQLASLH
ncbi:tetratricopeptide repeat-containing sensor histidine kinase [Mucilaginibacter xinganensis]|uniref:Two-component sensor histidine kinase n=1 Tax=Mucilaginibacter xinganensis TaxID=1234841 RepID=A0A223NW84_9SPHI|nr:histidine kinase [Mucilaginibacter xinganensis]ASU34149.1 two-component sensor histidine kinase [Mucilaginibacter xinganensis]